MSTILYIGNFRPEYSTENDVRKGFEALGHQVIPIQEDLDGAPHQFAKHIVETDLLLWTSTWDHSAIGNAANGVAYQCARNGVPSAAYHLDTFWSTRRGGRAWWNNPMWRMQHVFTVDADPRWDFFGVNHHWLPAGIRHDACYIGEPRTEYVCDVAFVGADGVNTPYHNDVPGGEYRVELVRQLWAMCERNGWSFRNPGGSEPKVDRGGDLNDFYASTKVVVGDSLKQANPEDTLYWSDRVYETLGRGGLLVMPKIWALADQFSRRLPLYDWGDWDLLERKIGAYISTPMVRRAIREETFEIVRDHHTYKNRAQTILEVTGVT